ncbi:hypothetical protein Daus18300_008093 [Diaporthe australafricana]|uniref:Myb-like domain-containing protein n=1 Tax=Diaporthe australafricana TaxID=127596 RepID=A0ABR3WJX1_9PEZI
MFYHVRCPCCLLTIYTSFVDDGINNHEVVSLAEESLVYFNCPLPLCRFHCSDNQVNLYANWAPGNGKVMVRGFTIGPRTSDTIPFRSPGAVADLAYPATAAQAKQQGSRVPASGPANPTGITQGEQNSRPEPASRPARPANISGYLAVPSGSGLAYPANIGQGKRPGSPLPAPVSYGLAYPANVGRVPAPPPPGYAHGAGTGQADRHGIPTMPPVKKSQMTRASQEEENEQDKGNLAAVNPDRRAGIKWTTEEEKRLWDMARRGCTYDQMIKELGRSQSSIKGKITAMRRDADQQQAGMMKRRI